MDPAELDVLVKQGGFGNVTNNAYLKVQSRASNEITSIMQVITYLSGEVEKSDEPLDFVKERDWNKKINERFVAYKPRIEEDLQTLMPLYKDKYKLAWSQSGISEGRRDEISALLSIRSRNELRESDDDPMIAMDKLAKWLCEEAAKSVKENQEYSEAAVRYFLYTEFQRCNVFPNEVGV